MAVLTGRCTRLVDERTRPPSVTLRSLSGAARTRAISRYAIGRSSEESGNEGVFRSKAGERREMGLAPALNGDAADDTEPPVTRAAEVLDLQGRGEDGVHFLARRWNSSCCSTRPE